MSVTPRRFVDYAWSLDLRVFSADKSLLKETFIGEATDLAEREGIAAHYLDFSQYENPEQALSAPENEAFMRELENPSGKVLLWFDNCDSLAPLSCDLTFKLRSILTTRIGSEVQSVFIAKRSSLTQLFYDIQAAFYQENHNITSYTNT